MEQKTHQNNSHIPHIQDDELLDEIMQLAAHFEGKLPETSEELFDYYCLLGRKVFDMIDSDQDGEGQTARQTHRQVDRKMESQNAFVSLVPQRVRCTKPF